MNLKYFNIGRVWFKLGFDWNGHWITCSHGHKNMLWLWIGPTYEKEGLIIYNFILGPIGIGVAVA